MIKAIKAAYAAYLKTNADLAHAATKLSVATRDFNATLERLNASSAAVEENTRYLAAAEKHRRQQKCEKHDF